MDNRNKQILNIALPAIVSNITVPLLGLVDVAIVGHLGAAAYIGAIAVGGMTFNVVYWIFGFLRMGTSGMTSQALGRRDLGETARMLVRSVGIAFAVAFALIALQIPLREASLAIMQPTEEVARLMFKRVAMSSGGFSGKGVFASMAYLVVEYDGGKQKQCNFKDERDVDALLEVLAKEQPQLHLLSAAGEQALEKKAAEKAARKLPELSEDAQHSLTVLRRAKEYLDAKPELSAELSAAERRKRAQLQSKPVYRYVALAIFVLGVAAAAYGLYSVFSHTGSYGVYFALFGFAAIFLFSSYNMLPTAHNNNNAIMKRADKAEAAMAEYVKHYPHGAFPVASWYAHPIVLKQMMDAVEEGRAVTVPEALEAVKTRLKSLNADVEVEQEEYDEVVVIKALFLNHDYQ